MAGLTRLPALLWAIVALLVAIPAPALAQDFPALSGRVVDQAELLPDAQELALTDRLEQLERASTRQLVVATVSTLQDRSIEDYGYQLGRHWGIGQQGANNGAILLVAPNERKVRIEVGYGLEGILTDALTGQIVRGTILPRFRDGDYPGGIEAGVDALIAALQAPPEIAEQRAQAAALVETPTYVPDNSQSGVPSEVWSILFLLLLGGALSLAGGGNGGGRPYPSAEKVRLWESREEPRASSSSSSWGSGGGWGSSSPPSPSSSWGSSSGSSSSSKSSSSWSSGSSSGSSKSGFSGGGGSFGGGGASGSW